MKKNNKTQAETVALEYVVHNASTRAAWQAEKGVGLNAGATYVSRHIEMGALKASAQAVSEGKLEWGEEEVGIIVSGNKGVSARFGRVSKCGGFVEVVGTTGAKGVLSVSIFGEKGTLEIVSLSDLAKLAKKGQAFTFTRSHDEQTFTGRILRNSLDCDICALAYGTDDGRLLCVDIETDKHNAHNTEMRGFVAGGDETAIEQTDAVIALVAAGAKRATGKKKGKRAAKK